MNFIKPEEIKKTLVFGNVILNGHASIRNPHRTGIFVKFKKSGIYVTNGGGEFWTIILDKETKVMKVGCLILET